MNAALKLNGILPIHVVVKKIQDYHIEFESSDIGTFGTVQTTEEILDCHNPYDPFALHKAALIATGIIPLKNMESLQDILTRLGSGIYISTQVMGIPKGSGLGTSSILAGACVKALLEFMGKEPPSNKVYDIVLGMEQLMSVTDFMSCH